MHSAEPVLKAKGIVKSYNTIKVLKGVEVEIYPSEIVSVVGKSGSGKSTLLNILSSLDDPDEGYVEMLGTRYESFSPNELANHRNLQIGFIFQFHHLLPELTAVENVILPGLIAKKNRSDVTSRAKELLDFLGLDHRLEHKPQAMSGGEQQRVAIARSLINDPPVVFADEPTGNLDESTSRELHELIISLRDLYNKSFVVVTHSKELAAMSDRQLTLVNGTIDYNTAGNGTIG